MSEIFSFGSFVFLIYIFIYVGKIDKTLEKIKTSSYISIAEIDCKKINKNYPPGLCKWTIKIDEESK